MSSERSIGQNFTFIIRNYPSSKEIMEIIYLEFESVYCERDSGFEETVAVIGGNVVVIECEGMKSGYKSRSCMLSDSGAKWGKIIDNCEINIGAVLAIVISVMIVLILIILGVVYTLLKNRKFRKRATSSVLIKQNKSGSISVENPIQV